MIAQARLADRFRQNTGRPHPRFGNGTLLSVALNRPGADPISPGDPEYLACFALMIDVVLARYSPPDPGKPR